MAGNSYLILRYLPDTMQLRVATPQDTDGDALPDAWELTHFANLNVSDDGGDDFDNDHVPDWYEYVAETDSANTGSFLRVTHMSHPPRYQGLPSSQRSSTAFTPRKARPAFTPWSGSNVPGAGSRTGARRCRRYEFLRGYCAAFLLPCDSGTATGVAGSIVGIQR